jgi:hypothetical protein
MQKIHPSSATEFQDAYPLLPDSLRQMLKRCEINYLIIVIEKIADPETRCGLGIF